MVSIGWSLLDIEGDFNEAFEGESSGILTKAREELLNNISVHSLNLRSEQGKING